MIFIKYLRKYIFLKNSIRKLLNIKAFDFQKRIKKMKHLQNIKNNSSKFNKKKKKNIG